MKPFGCHVTILNTLDYLGKFDGKSDEGFFVRYLMNSKAFWVYNIRTRKVKENLHIRFLEDKPIIAGDGPKWLFDIDVLTKSMNYVPVVVGTNSNDFVGIEESIGAAFSDAGKKDDEGVCKESGIDDQERPENKVDMRNITTTYPVPSTLNKRIHKDHSIDHVIGDVQFSVQTRRMTKTINEQGFLNAVYEGKIHEDLHTCLFAYFLSQVEPKKKVCTLVDLPYGKRAIGTKWVYRNKKDKRGFEDPEFPDRVYKVEKALYGLHQAPRACQDKYVDEILKKFGFSTVRIASTPMETSKPLLKDAEAEDVDFHLYRSMIGSLMYLTAYRPHIINYAGASLDRKSTIGAKEWEDRMERVATTASSLEAEKDSGSGPRCQDTILGSVKAQIRFGAPSKQSNDPPLSRVNKLGSGEDNMKLKELMEFCTKLSERALDL
ncbi:hypothetical protein Tco_0587939 [Tanacetum coccineum]